MAWNRQEWESGIGDYNLDGHLDLFKTHFRRRHQWLLPE